MLKKASYFLFYYIVHIYIRFIFGPIYLHFSKKNLQQSCLCSAFVVLPKRCLSSVSVFVPTFTGSFRWYIFVVSLVKQTTCCTQMLFIWYKTRKLLELLSKHPYTCICFVVSSAAKRPAQMSSQPFHTLQPMRGPTPIFPLIANRCGPI